MTKPINFSATADCAVLGEALKIVKGTMFPRGERASDRCVLVQGSEGRLTLSTSDLEATTRVEVAGASAKDGQAMVVYRDLVDVVKDWPAESIPLHEVTVRDYPATWFPASGKHPPQVASIDGPRFRAHLPLLLRVAGTDERVCGVRFWLTQHAVLLQAGDHFRMNVVQIPATVQPTAVGRTVLLRTHALETALRGLTGPQIELGLYDDAKAATVSICSGPTTLLTSAVSAAPVGLSEMLFSDAVASVALNRGGALTALKRVKRRAGWSEETVHRPVIVHLDAQSPTITHGGEDVRDDGRVVVLEAERLRTALTSFPKRHSVTVHLRTATPSSPVIFTAGGTRLGDLDGVHHLTAQVGDPRRSQARRRFNPSVRRSVTSVGCALRPRTLAALHRARDYSPKADDRAIGPCVRDDGRCDRCSIFERFHAGPDLPTPPSAERVLVYTQPKIGPVALDPPLWLIEDPTSDAWRTTAKRTSFAELAVVGPWEIGRRYHDPDMSGFWLERTNCFAD